MRHLRAGYFGSKSNRRLNQATCSAASHGQLFASKKTKRLCAVPRIMTKKSDKKNTVFSVYRISFRPHPPRADTKRVPLHPVPFTSGFVPRVTVCVDAACVTIGAHKCHHQNTLFFFIRGAFQDRLLRDAVFNKAEEDERITWRGLLGAGNQKRERTGLLTLANAVFQ